MTIRPLIDWQVLTDDLMTSLIVIAFALAWWELIDSRDYPLAFVTGTVSALMWQLRWSPWWTWAEPIDTDIEEATDTDV